MKLKPLFYKAHYRLTDLQILLEKKIYRYVFFLYICTHFFFYIYIFFIKLMCKSVIIAI